MKDKKDKRWEVVASSPGGKATVAECESKREALACLRDLGLQLVAQCGQAGRLLMTATVHEDGKVT